MIVLILSAFFSVSMMGCSKPARPQNDPIRVLLNQGPITLHPRRSIDGIGQRLGALVFEGLTRIGPNLEVQPGHATSWSHTEDGLSWTFTLREGAKDHLDRPITSADWAQCLESYRLGTPPSPLASAFPSWTGTQSQGQKITLRFSKPDPYLLTDLSVIRFFRNVAGENCPAKSSPGGLVGSGDFYPETGTLKDLSPQTELLLLSRAPDRSPLRFLFVKDDNTRALLLARGSVDVAINAFSTGKWKWVRETLASKYRVLEKEGINVSYLGFNVRHPHLDHTEVRRAIGLAISRKEIVNHWLNGIGSVATTLLSPVVAESIEKEVPDHESLADAERLLDAAGFRPDAKGVRFQLQYLTTTIREGFEMGLLIRDQLARVGIQVNLRVVEPSVFYQSLKGGDFDLYSSRWIGAQDASLIHTAYFSTSPRNRTGFADPAVDRALLSAVQEMNGTVRKRKFAEIQKRLLDQAVYLPLWYWNNDVAVSTRLTGLEPQDTSVSGAYEPLARLKWRTP